MAEEQPRTHERKRRGHSHGETRWFWRLPQGVTEHVPIGSSLGHTVIIPGLLGWTALVQSQMEERQHKYR